MILTKNHVYRPIQWTIGASKVIICNTLLEKNTAFHEVIIVFLEGGTHSIHIHAHRVLITIIIIINCFSTIWSSLSGQPCIFQDILATTQVSKKSSKASKNTKTYFFHEGYLRAPNWQVLTTWEMFGWKFTWKKRKQFLGLSLLALSLS